MKTLLRLLRVKQYSKNVFVLAALVFTKGFGNPDLLLKAFGAVAVMCLLGSATYIANDLIDRERDRAHPKKQLRPIASGAVSVPFAVVLGGICLLAGLGLAVGVGLPVLYSGLFYLSLQVAYNLSLKRVPIADVFTIAAGFVLRVVIGAVAINAQLSGWILLCTGSLALLLGFGKRRSEFVALGSEAGKSRESLLGYTLPTLDGLVILAATGAALCYGIYGIESRTARENPALLFTIPFVAFGVCRYMMLIFAGETDEPESVVLRDPQLLLSFILFALTAIWALSGVKVGFLN